ncbi:hypothetical protein L6164_014423 [Bauhinia variegata]|uniref:Uncharacterized protein n=1 Tax=Bauhinia variegata TaxID=167791 RepID=A0ACB9NIY1_BAUVA|nr:hypothetical protein L6164_014423 [Bauhinia variegata]
MLVLVHSHNHNVGRQTRNSRQLFLGSRAAQRLRFRFLPCLVFSVIHFRSVFLPIQIVSCKDCLWVPHFPYPGLVQWRESGEFEVWRLHLTSPPMEKLLVF